MNTFNLQKILDFFNYIFKSPIVFFYNALIILFTLSFSFLFKRRKFVLFIISAVWLGFGITNGIILRCRVTPFTATDFRLIKNGLEIASSYLSPFFMVLIGIGLLALLVYLIILYIRGPKLKSSINYKKNGLAIIILSLFLLISTKVLISTNILADYFGNIAFAYLDYGFPYCFSNTLLNTGIKKPSNYSKETIANILNSDIAKEDPILIASNGNKLTTKSNEDLPNIIMIQLESFFDPTLVKGLSFSEDPIPYFRELSNNYSSGYLNVPSVGAGTANTEFETISGLNLDFFGPGEYPYNTILKNKACSSINYALKESGYSTHAIHNHQGNFYGRNTVFSNLGFDTFTPIEFMNATEKTPVGWAKDSALITPIMESLTSTEGKDFIYTISVQGHGSYIGSDALENKYVNLTSIENEGIASALEYYVNQLYEMDVFIADLIEAVSSLNEDCIIVFYGDHLPSLGLTDESLSTGNIYETEYVIWDNMGLEKNDVDLEAYQLTSKVLYDLHMNNGIFTQLHQSYLFGLENEQFAEKDSYLDALRSLQYDILYGDEYLYNSQEAPKPTNLQFGINPIILNDVYLQDGQLVATGENFNENTIFLVDGNFINTTFIDSNTVTCPAPELKPEGSAIFLGQISGGAQLLSATVTVTVMP